MENYCQAKKRVLFSFLCLLMSCSTPSSAPSSSTQSGSEQKPPEERARLMVEAANAAMVDGDPIGALQYLKSAEEIAPRYAPIYHGKALAFNMRKDLPKALVEMKKAVDLEPKQSAANNTYGKLLLDAGKFNEAEIYLKKAAEDPTFRESYKARTSLGMLYYRENKLDLADQQFEKAGFDDPNNACIAYYYRGHIALKKSDPQEAVKQYTRATQKFCAGFADAHFALGVAYEREKKWEEARKKYLEVRQNFPESKAAEQAMQRLPKLP